MKTNTKPYGYGSYTPEKVEAIMSNGCLQQRGDGFYQPAKPIPYYSFFERVVQAWHVLTYQADPLYWHFKNPYERTSNGFRKMNHSELDQDTKETLQEAISDPEIVKQVAVLGAEDQNKMLDQDNKYKIN